MSGGAGTASTGAHSSSTNFSNPAGAHMSSIRAGCEPTTLKPCGISRGPYTNVPGARVQPRAVANEPHVAVEHVERFVLVVMHVVGRCQAGRHRHLLHQAEAPVGLLAGRVQHGG